MYVYPVHCTCDIYHTSSKQSIGWPSMCSTFSLLNVDLKLCLHGTNDVQPLKLTQRYGILACCWCHWCTFCTFSLFQLFFLKFVELLKIDPRLQFLSLQKYFEIVRFWCWNQPKNVTNALLVLLYNIYIHYIHVVHRGSCLCRYVRVPQYLYFRRIPHIQQAMYSFAIDVFKFLSFGCRVETACACYKRRANIETYTTI